jgi:hypothetical protein
MGAPYARQSVRPPFFVFLILWRSIGPHMRESMCGQSCPQAPSQLMGQGWPGFVDKRGGWTQTMGAATAPGWCQHTPDSGMPHSATDSQPVSTVSPPRRDECSEPPWPGARAARDHTLGGRISSSRLRFFTRLPIKADIVSTGTLLSAAKMLSKVGRADGSTDWH